MNQSTKYKLIIRFDDVKVIVYSNLIKLIVH